jgi:hypothetical protein
MYAPMHCGRTHAQQGKPAPGGTVPRRPPALSCQRQQRRKLGPDVREVEDDLVACRFGVENLGIWEDGCENWR